ncbi:hypothetical protein RFI_04578, partial [Reticulomyxa filosa]
MLNKSRPQIKIQQLRNELKQVRESKEKDTSNTTIPLDDTSFKQLIPPPFDPPPLPPTTAPPTVPPTHQDKEEGKYEANHTSAADNTKDNEKDKDNDNGNRSKIVSELESELQDTLSKLQILWEFESETSYLEEFTFAGEPTACQHISWFRLHNINYFGHIGGFDRLLARIEHASCPISLNELVNILRPVAQ